MNTIDTHAHVYVAEFGEEQSMVMQRATEEGVSKILMPAIDSNTHASMLQTEAAYPGLCISMMGVHPCSVKADFKEELRIASEWFEKRKFVAVGEIGLDFYWDKTYEKEQRLAFNEQIEMALQYEVPVSIHSRNATEECIDIVKQHQQGKLKGVFHCFSGNAEQAAQVIELGFFLGIGGVVTFKNAGLDKILSEVSLDKIVLETDAPYLAPVPYRGKRNEPAYLKYVVAKLAEIYQCSREKIVEETTKNAKDLFGI